MQQYNTGNLDRHQRLTAAVLPLLVLAGIAAFFYSLTWGDQVAGYLSDDAIYLIMAQVFSPWPHATDLLQQFMRTDSHFPPLYPVLLGLFGAGPQDPALASAISIAFLVIAVAVFGVWVYLETGRRLPALLLPVVFALLPGTVIFTQGLWSEFLFMVFFYAALALAAVREPDRSHWLACSLFIALTSLTRAVGVAFIAAYCLYLILKRPRYYLLQIPVAALPFLYWATIINVRSTEHGYFGILLGALSSEQGRWSGLYHALLLKLAAMYRGWEWQFRVSDILPGSGWLIHAVLACLLLAALAGFLQRLRHARLDALCLLAYAATVIVWPFSDQNFVTRFVFPVTPLLLFYAVHAAGMLAYRPRRVAVLLLCAAVIISAWSPATYVLQRAYAPAPEGLAPYKHDYAWFYSRSLKDAVASARGSRDLFQALRKVGTLVPENECIFSFQTALVMLHTHRISGVYPPPSVSDAAFAHATRGCRYMLALPLTSINSDFPEYYPLQRIAKDPSYTITPIRADTADEDHSSPVILIRRNTGG